MGMSMTELTLYYREGCHLCEEMNNTLELLAVELGFTISYVDIDEDPVLRRRFNEKIPVLMIGEDVVCCHFLDEQSLRQALIDG